MPRVRTGGSGTARPARPCWWVSREHRRPACPRCSRLHQRPPEAQSSMPRSDLPVWLCGDHRVGGDEKEGAPGDPCAGPINRGTTLAERTGHPHDDDLPGPRTGDRSDRCGSRRALFLLERRRLATGASPEEQRKTPFLAHETQSDWRRPHWNPHRRLRPCWDWRRSAGSCWN